MTSSDGNGSAANIALTSRECAKVRLEQIRLLNEPSFNAAIATAFAAAFLAYIQWDAIDHAVILVWLSVMGLVIAARIGIYFSFKYKKPDTAGHWEPVYVGVTIIAGLVWGAAGMFLFPEDDPVRQAATIVILAGMAAGAGTTLSALRSTVLIFLSLIMTPLTIHLFLVSGDVMDSIAVMCVVYTLFLAYSANHTYKTHLTNIVLRIRSTEREKAVRRSERSLRETSEILEMIAKGEPATVIYDAIARLYESRHPGLRCSMMQRKGNRLMHGGAPSLPETYCGAINGLECGPNAGSCGTSTYTGERVLVEDIATDPRWAALKDHALAHGMRSCWSEPIRDSSGKVLGAFGMYYDYPAMPDANQLADLESAARLAGIVMERQQREVLLEKLHSAFEYANDAIIIADLDARLEYVNPAFERMTGYSAEEAVGQYIKILRSNKHPDDFYEMLLRNSQEGRSWQGEVIIKCKDGSFREVERSVAPVFDDRGNVLFQIAIQRDITEQKLLEEKFQQAQKMEAIGTLVGGIAHDFNNILAGINGNLYLTRKHVGNSPDVLQKLSNIEQLSDHAAELIRQMLTFARKDRVNMERLQLLPLVKDGFGFLRASVPENIEMQLETEDKSSLPVQGDNTQLHQVLMNLVNNARDALEGVSEPYIHIKLGRFYADDLFVEQHKYFQSGYYAHLSVTDNGCGIPVDQIERLFDPFFTTKEVGKGTGLGLSMVFGAIKRHHGYIEVESTEGKGSVFHVYIPLEKSVAASSVCEQGKENVGIEMGDRELILLVDDEAHILDIGKEVLEALNYRVVTASNGLEAIDVFTEYRDDIAMVLTDVVMPKLGGVQSIERIRKLCPDVKVIFSTGYDKNASFPDNTFSDDVCILSKPYDIGVLSKTIRSILDSTE